MRLEEIVPGPAENPSPSGDVLLPGDPLRAGRNDYSSFGQNLLPCRMPMRHGRVALFSHSVMIFRVLVRTGSAYPRFSCSSAPE